MFVYLKYEIIIIIGCDFFIYMKSKSVLREFINMYFRTAYRMRQRHVPWVT